MAINKKPASSDTDEQKYDDGVEKFAVNDATAEPEPAPKPDSQKEPTDPGLHEAMDQAERQTDEKPKPAKLSRKKLWLIISAALVVLIAVLFAVPMTRYALLGVFVKKDVTVDLLDSTTHKPVSGVTVSAAGKTATTDAQGKATVRGVPVGDTGVTAKKKYYQDLSSKVLVPVFGRKDPYQLNIVATGRQVTVKIMNKVSNQPLSKATVTFDGATSTTDDKGEAVLVLPADKANVSASVTADGFNKASVTVQVLEVQDPKNIFFVTPSGQVYFLSKRSGTIDVLKSDLDGSNVATVLSGTGKEDDNETTLLASRDWKYLALRAHRDGDKSKLYLIDATKDDKLTTMDEGDATFEPVGWYNEYFIYTLSRTQVQNWQAKKNALKSFNAATGQLTVLDESDGLGNANSYAQENFEYTYILRNQLAYNKRWYGDSLAVAGKHSTVNAVQPNGQNRHTLKDFDTTNAGLSAQLYKPEAAYYQFATYQPVTNTYYEYEDGQFKTASDITPETFAKSYPTFLISPSGKSTFWSESRDGKNTLFLGDSDANDGKPLLSLADYKPYGWLSDDYLLVSKSNSELYILPRNNPGTPLKITDYHKPAVSFSGYGYGYGGL